MQTIAVRVEELRPVQGPSLAHRTQRIPELDGLRGVAILLVITKHYGVYHLPGLAGSFAGDFLSRVFPELYAPDLFLVLTGFLLGGRLLTALDAPGHFSSFYCRRVCRTFPLYYVLLVCFAAGVLTQRMLAPIVALDLEWPFGTPWALAAYALFLQSFCIAATGSLGPYWLGITWTLAVQEQFYLVLPWLLRCTPRRALGWVLAGLFVTAPLSRLLVVRMAAPHEWYGYIFLLWCRTDPLIVGVLAAWLLQGESARKRLMCVGWMLGPVAVVLFLCFAAVAYSGYSLETPAVFVLGDMYRALLYLALVLIAVFASQGWVGAVLRTRWLRELGRISYGLFLFHMLVRDLFFRVVFGAPPFLGGWESWLATFEAFLLTGLLAEMSWHYLEKPLIGWSKSK